MLEVPDRWEKERFDQWAARIAALDPFGGDHDVIFQMPFLHDGMRGVADFLLRVERDGVTTWEPLDAKLARAEAKPGHILQLCFYADAITAATGVAPEHLHIWLGSGDIERVRLDDVHAYWRRLRHQLDRVMADDTADATAPEPCTHCDFCDFAPTCKAEWRAADSLVHVAGLAKADRRAPGRSRHTHHRRAGCAGTPHRRRRCRCARARPTSTASGPNASSGSPPRPRCR